MFKLEWGVHVAVPQERWASGEVCGCCQSQQHSGLGKLPWHIGVLHDGWVSHLVTTISLLRMVVRTPMCTWEQGHHRERTLVLSVGFCQAQANLVSGFSPVLFDEKSVLRVNSTKFTWPPYWCWLLCEYALRRLSCEVTGLHCFSIRFLDFRKHGF